MVVDLILLSLALLCFAAATINVEALWARLLCAGLFFTTLFTAVNVLQRAI